MKRLAYLLGCMCFLMLWSSCRKDFEFSPSTGHLEFSKDTVYLDTVFTNIGSSTYNLKVYNRSNEDIRIPTIRLGQGQNSNYRLNIDGMAGKEFENVELLAKDSMYVFVETTIDINDFPNPDGTYLYTDQIQFDSGSNQQNVELVTLVQDAIFIYPNQNSDGVIETLSLTIDGETIETTIQGRYLETSELTFTNEKPYVIYGYAAVPNGETLTIDSGARLHFHANSGLLVAQEASIQVNGSLSTDQDLLENEVIFEGDRLEPLFSDIPGQWGGIILLDGSQGNSFTYATVKNASVGIWCENDSDDVIPKLSINNSQLYNFSNFGILGINTSITAKNLVINNAGQSGFAAFLGGKYNFTHCTLANYWNSSFRQFPSVLLTNFLEQEDAIYIADLTEANFNNCIIFGNDNVEFLVEFEEEQSVTTNFKFTNCLIRFDSGSTNLGPLYNFSDTSHYEGNIFNQQPDFMEPFENELIIGQDSAGNGEADSFFASQVPNDILGTSRTTSPDMGAYQHILFEN